jgi:N-formylglutamate amidohydrolase
MPELILHIPHSSTYFPNKDGFIIDQKKLNGEIQLLTDWHTEDLFESNKDVSIIAPFSRIFCDVERFADDNQEEMAQYGMGVCYETTDDGRKMRNVSGELKNQILSDHYRPHHRRLEEAVDQQLQKHARAVIIDCHSFTDTPFQRDLNQDPNRPDIDIGTDSFHTPQKLLDLTRSHFELSGYRVGLNRPYGGTMIPLKHCGKEKNVHSVMIEINRKLYLQERTSEKNNHYTRIKKTIAEYLDHIREIYLNEMFESR